jgi:predicted DNA-binding protein
MQQSTTKGNSFRINKEILEKVKTITKTNGQTISGYINTKLSKVVDKDWNKFSNSKLN